MDIKAKSIQYTTVTGFFLQDDPSIDASKFDYVRDSLMKMRTQRLINAKTTVDFGLINREYDADSEYDANRQKTQWQRFERQVAHLNKQTAHNVQHRVLYLVCHRI